jgi:acyl carrier protein
MSDAIANASVEALMPEVANLIIEALNLDMAAHEVEPDAPLYGDGLGLDSIDMLEMSLVISKQYGFELKSDVDNKAEVFGSLRGLTTHIARCRTK